MVVGAPRSPRILVIQRRYFGDLILLEPFLRNLRSAHPNAWITLVVDQGYGDVLEGSESLDAIAELPVAGSLRQRGKRWQRLLTQVASKRFDLAVDLARNERAAVVLALSRARRRVSYEISDDIAVRRRRRSDALRRKLMTPERMRATRAEQKTVHVVDWNNRLLERLGVPTPHRVPRLAVDADARLQARKLLEERIGRREPGRRLVVFHVGARRKAHVWPAERFAALADRLESDHGCVPVLTAGPDQSDLLRAAAGARSGTKGGVLKAPSTLRLLYALLAEADLFVGNDSGPAHMASAVGTPTCVLFSDASTAVWRTLGPNDDLLQANLPCGDACVRPRVCAPGSARWCVQRIGVDEVATTIRRMLSRST